MRIPQDLLDEIVEHARADAPNECCGLIGAHDGVATSVHRTRNLKASPLAFEMDGMEVFRIIDAIEESGGELAGMYHSHTRTEPRPSQTDRNFARNWPGLEWVIVGLAGPEPEVRSFLIGDDGVREVEVA
ncbi:MAG TPA: M67 family metallopeptidase [Solirubrobacteraceae bacterium]|nr:M67 family metallopeptidase [Solirubrobacteraceae bacterium]